MRLVEIGLGLGIALSACTIETGYEPPPPPPWGVPMTGGTMTVTRDGNHAVVADPDRDRVVIVDLVRERVTNTFALAAGSQPGRAIEDGAGRIHVALRGSGELLTITGFTGHELRPICGEPRGLAWQETADVVHIACATGELVTVPAGGGDAVRTVRLERDLRDVLVRDGKLVVTTFRTAELLELDDAGAVSTRTSPPIVQRPNLGLESSSSSTVSAIPGIAWRTIALPDGTLVMAHQRRLGTVLRIVTGGYGSSTLGACSSAVESSLTVVPPGAAPVAVAPIVRGALPIDIAVHPTTGALAVVSAGQESVFVVSASATTQPDRGSCMTSTVAAERLMSDQVGAPSSVAYRPNGTLLIYYPDADGIAIVDGMIPRGLSLGGRPNTDAGRALFHRQTSSSLSCASCHPEGRDDGAVWNFDSLGLRRTQNLGGGILARAPYHWSGDMPTLHTLVEDVFTRRMGGDFVTPEEDRALGVWLDRIPAAKGVITDEAAVVRGEELFNSSETGCRSCHTGELLTNNRRANVLGYGTTDVTTAFKVPSLLGVGARAPFMHDGCAATLRDRFGPCGGAAHGSTSQLTPAELDDLIAYLEAL
jgi:hypothetical protein